MIFSLDEKEGHGMDKHADRSVALSRVCVAFFALCLLALDIGAYWIARWFVLHRFRQFQYGFFLMIDVYTGSIPGWICLFQLRKLLANIGRGAVFTPANVRCLQLVSRCCFAVAVICLVSAVYYPSFVVAAAAAGFTALIVRVVKNILQQAAVMKDELDLTI